MADFAAHDAGVSGKHCQGRLLSSGGYQIAAPEVLLVLNHATRAVVDTVEFGPGFVRRDFDA